MKKKILFVSNHLGAGGIEKSLLSLLKNIDYEKYEVHLLLFENEGVFLNEIPPHVKLLTPLLPNSVISLTKKDLIFNKCRLAIIRVARLTGAILGRLFPNFKWKIYWTFFKKVLFHANERYDVAISYADVFCNYFVIDKVKANNKILYNHFNYEAGFKTGIFQPNMDYYYFKTAHNIVTVGKESYNSLCRTFPDISEKIHIIENIISPSEIQRKSLEEGYTDDFKGTRIATVSRLAPEKGILLAVNACELLIRQGYNIRWYIVGDGHIRTEIEREISHRGLEDYFILLGTKVNPYPFMLNCDVYVQPSLTESNGMTVTEAKILYRPIVVTDIPAFKEQITNRETGIVVSINAGDIAEGVKKLLESKELRDRLSQSLKHEDLDNSNQVNKLYRLMDNRR